MQQMGGSVSDWLSLTLCERWEILLGTSAQGTVGASRSFSSKTGYVRDERVLSYDVRKTGNPESQNMLHVWIEAGTSIASQSAFHSYWDTIMTSNNKNPHKSGTLGCVLVLIGCKQWPADQERPVRLADHQHLVHIQRQLECYQKSA